MGRVMHKRADAIGSGTADPSTAPARAVPVPQLAIENKPAPGQRGPSGLGGRTTYSRVNTGTPPTPDMGASAQKSQGPRGLEFLPKTASQENETMATTTTGRPSLQTLIKSAMAGAAARVDVSLEAAQQLANAGGTPPQTKTASVRDKDPAVSPSIPTEVTTKLASALDYVARQLNPKLAEIDLDSATSDGVGPGEGPGALEVTPATTEVENIDAGEMGSANLQPPKDPPTQKDPTRPADPSTGLETNDGPGVGEQPEEPISNEKTTMTNDEVKAASAHVNNLIALGLAKVAFDQSGRMVLEKTALSLNPLQNAANANTAGSTVGGAASGGLGGAALGGLAGAALGKLTGLGAGTGAKWGAGLGGAAGAAYGGYKGNQSAQGSLANRAAGATNSAMNSVGLKAASVKMAKEEETGLERAGRRAGSLAGTLIGGSAGVKGGKKLTEAIGSGRLGKAVGTIGGGLIGAGAGHHLGGRLGRAVGSAAEKGVDYADPKGKKKESSVKSAAAAMVCTVKSAAGGATGLLSAGGGVLGDVAGGRLGGYPGSIAGGALGTALGGGLGGALEGGDLDAALAGARGGVLGGVGPAALGGVIAGDTGRRIGGSLGSSLGGSDAVQRLLAQREAMQAAPDKTASILARNLMALGLYKQAEDAINPAQISAGKIDDIGDQPPDGAVGSGEGAPAEPSDVNAQKRKMVSSNEAAINYTKRDAKADPKGDLGDVLSEPALSASTDATLDKTLDNTDEAGAKISSARRDLSKVAAARAVLAKVAQCHGVQSKKVKRATMGGAPSTPQAASGFTAGAGM